MSAQAMALRLAIEFLVDKVTHLPELLTVAEAARWHAGNPSAEARATVIEALRALDAAQAKERDDG